MRKCFLENIDIHWRTLMFAIAAGYIKGDYADRVKETATKLTGKKQSQIFEACELLLDAGPDACIKVWDGWKEGRKKAKAINFGYVYGMYEKKFIQTAKTKYGWEPTWDEAHACREGYFQLYSELPNWHSKQKKLVKLNGYVRTMFGRKRRLPGIYAKDKMKRMEAERQAINSPVQGTIGDWKAAVLVEVHETIDHSKFKLVGEHHDALLGLVREGCEDETLPQLIQIIRKPKLLETFKIKLDIPMDGEVEIGPWGQKGNVKYTLPTERKAA
jgi:DNA polymerase I-like protein with 3'-5' exonuclease and polymerase domains